MFKFPRTLVTEVGCCKHPVGGSLDDMAMTGQSAAVSRESTMSDVPFLQEVETTSHPILST
jgi:hypothetical protein